MTLRLALLALTACAAATPPAYVPALRPASPGVPPSVWSAATLRDPDGCEPWWMEPMVLCVGTEMAWDGCKWGCR